MAPLVEGLIAGYGIAIPVGAIAILIVDMGMQCGFRIGFMAGAGAASADLLYVTVAATAGTTLVTILMPVAFGLQSISALLLFGLGGYGLYRGLRGASHAPKSARLCGPLRMYGQFLGLTIINPLTVVYFTALILGRGDAASWTILDHLAFVVGAGLASLSWQTLLAGLGAFAQHQLSPRFQLAAVVFGNLVIIGFGLRMVLRLPV